MNFENKFLSIYYNDENIDLHYTSWGEKNTKKLFCVHGLTRNSRDFDYIAQELSKFYHVICIDLPGRGQSSYLKNRYLYNYQTYLQCIYKLLNFYDVTSVDWIGSSLGGILGMKIASTNLYHIDKLVLNDIGPFVPYKSLSKISTYVDKYPAFQNLLEAENYLKKIIPNFGIKSEIDWQYITQSSFFLNKDGQYYQTYDPILVKTFIEDHIEDIVLWEDWYKITSKILVLRGEKSNILLKDTAKLMEENKNTILYELKEVGHTPSLMNNNEINIISNWLK